MTIEGKEKQTYNATYKQFIDDGYPEKEEVNVKNICDWKKQQVIDKASEWLIENYPTNDGGELYVFIKEFKKAMQGV